MKLTQSHPLFEALPLISAHSSAPVNLDEVRRVFRDAVPQPWHFDLKQGDYVASLAPNRYGNIECCRVARIEVLDERVTHGAFVKGTLEAEFALTVTAFSKGLPEGWKEADLPWNYDLRISAHQFESIRTAGFPEDIQQFVELLAQSKSATNHPAMNDVAA